MASQFPPIVHHVTTNSAIGTCSFYPTSNPPPTQPISASMIMHCIYSTPPSVTTASNADLTRHLSLLPSPTSPTPQLPTVPPAGGSALAVLEIAPNTTGEEGVLNCTNTVDYVFMMDGELELSVDSGEKRTIRKGEFLVQRWGMHSWRNLPETEGARMLARCLGAEGAVEGEMKLPG